MKSGVYYGAVWSLTALLTGLCVGTRSLAQTVAPTNQTSAVTPKESASLADAVPPAQWARVEKSVDHALAWLSLQQQADGSFSSIETGQPAVTSLCVLAFLSRGHHPGSGPYGARLTRAVEFVLKSQQADGLFSYLIPEQGHVHLGASHTATYNHAIAGLMLTEIFGSTAGEQNKRVKLAVERGLQYTLRFQHEPRKPFAEDQGGWRYVQPYDSSFSDLSVTSWHLMFLRSARNAEFTVPAAVVESALEYVQRCFDERTGLFYYGSTGQTRYSDRAMMGAGTLSLSLGGKHQTEMARRAGDWLLAHQFNAYGGADLSVNGRADRFHYSAYYCSQAMAQLGGRYWQGFFPSLVRTFLENQAADGSWMAEQGEDSMFGPTYSTALSVLTLTPPLQLLPIYQR